LREESEFFDQPDAAADFDHWSKFDYWSLDEAIALILGKAPERVSWEAIAFMCYSPFVKQYARLRDLTQRAQICQQLVDPIAPAIFLRWAEDRDIPVPTELSEKVARIWGTRIDWKKNYDELKSMCDQRTADAEDVAKTQKKLIEAQMQIAEREAELAALRGAMTITGPAKVQSPIERQNMLKVIFGMAVVGYSYKPEDKRSKVIPEIVSDLERQGFSVSDDTVRRFLKEAWNKAGEWREKSS
jgi:hypothetical protein